MFWRAVFRCFLVTASLFSVSLHASAQDRNVLFIVIDDLNDWIGPLGGHPDVITPNLDRLAQMGMTFTNAHTPAPICNPSRTAVLTGISPTTSGIHDNGQKPFREYSAVLADAVSLPQYFKNRGYEIVGTGKIFHGTNDTPNTQWDAYPSFSGGGVPQGRSPPLNGIAGIDVDGDGRALDSNLDWGPIEDPSVPGSPDFTPDTQEYKKAQWAASEVLADHAQPVFVALGFYRPHLPWYAPVKYFDLYEQKLLDGTLQLPPYYEDDLDDIDYYRMLPTRNHSDIVASGQWPDAVRAYLANVSYIDDMLGIVLDAFDQRLAENPTEEWLLVLWSDHGWHLGEKKHWKKSTLWEESTRSVLILAGDAVSPGTESAMPVGLIDIFPTLIDFAGLDEYPLAHGESLRPLIENPGADRDIPVVTSRNPIGTEGLFAIRSHRWRYSLRPNDTEELYDHASDPHHWTNLAAYPAFESVKADLGTHFFGWSIPVANRDIDLGAIATNGSKCIDDFDALSGPLDSHPDWTTLLFGQGGADYTLVGDRVEGPVGNALVTTDGVALEEDRNFILSVDVELGSVGSGAGLVFGLTDTGNYLEFQLLDGSDAGRDVRVTRYVDGQPIDLSLVDVLPDVGPGEYTVIAEYDASAPALKLLVLDPMDLAYFREDIGVGTLPVGSAFGLTSSGPGNTGLDEFKLLANVGVYELPEPKVWVSLIFGIAALIALGRLRS